MTTICDLDPAIATALHSAVGEAHVLFSLEDLRLYLEASPAESTVVLGPSVDQHSAYRLADAIRVSRPSLGVVLVRQRIDTAVLAEALRAGVREVVDERDLAGLNAAVRRSNGLSAAMREQGVGPAAGRAADRAGRSSRCSRPRAAAARPPSRRTWRPPSPTAAGARSAWSTSTSPSATWRSRCSCSPRTPSPMPSPLADSLDFTAVQAAAHPALPRADHPRRPGRAGQRGVDPGAAGRAASSSCCAITSTTSSSTPRRLSTTRCWPRSTVATWWR